MAEQTPDVMSELADIISDRVSAKSKKDTPIPEIYSSGMRGNEKPPHLREKKTDDKKGEKKIEKPGKKTVTFEASPKKKSAERIAELEKQIADLTKKVGKKKIKIE